MNSSTFQKCLVCMENFPLDYCDGAVCPEGHLVCGGDLTSYLAENVFPMTFKLRESKCAVKCPHPECDAPYNSLHLFSKMPAREKMRYMSILDDTFPDQRKGPRNLCSAMFDIMTLKCPSCSTPVDPLPDACSAVMCLNCGNHYCNYCFLGFNTGEPQRDRAAAHAHAAVHSTATKLEERDAFLPPEVIADGQREYQRGQLLKFVTLALTSTDHGTTGGHEIAIALIFARAALTDLKIDVFKLFNDAESAILGQTLSGRPRGGGKSPKRSNVGTEADDGNGAISATNSMDDDGDTSGDSVDGRGKGRRGDNGDGVQMTQAQTRRRGAQQLNNAILTGNELAFNQILAMFKENVDLDYIEDRHGLPLASLAMLTGQNWMAVELLQAGADPMVRNREGRSVVYIAAELGLVDVIDAIIGANPDMNYNVPVTDEEPKYCITHVAVRYNHGNIIQRLAQIGVDFDTQEAEHGYTPLMLALVLGHEWVAMELVSSGAKVALPVRNGRTPLFVAAEKGLTEMVRFMVRSYESPIVHPVTGAPMKVINSPVVFPTNLRLLHVAAFHNQAQVVSLLIDMDADLNVLEDESGYTPLAMAIIGDNASAALDLIAAGANPRIPSKAGRTAMYVAIERGMMEVALALLDVGVGINEKTTSERSSALPLHVAVLHSQSHMVPMLIKCGADVNRKDEEKSCTPLIMAAILQEEWTVRQLIKAGADPTSVSAEGRSALYIAAEKGHTGIIRLLIETCGLSVNSPCTSEQHRSTALHIACLFNHPNAVYLLLHLGADATLTDSNDRTPMDVAQEADSEAAMAVLAHNAPP